MLTCETTADKRCGVLDEPSHNMVNIT